MDNNGHQGAAAPAAAEPDFATSHKACIESAIPIKALLYNMPGSPLYGILPGTDVCVTGHRADGATLTIQARIVESSKIRRLANSRDLQRFFGFKKKGEEQVALSWSNRPDGIHIVAKPNQHLPFHSRKRVAAAAAALPPSKHVAASGTLEEDPGAASLRPGAGAGVHLAAPSTQREVDGAQVPAAARKRKTSAAELPAAAAAGSGGGRRRAGDSPVAYGPYGPYTLPPEELVVAHDAVPDSWRWLQLENDLDMLGAL